MSASPPAPIQLELCPVCELELVDGSTVTLYNDRFYHSGCFVCQKCGLSLGGQEFLEMLEPDSQDNVVSELAAVPAVVCKGCYSKKAPKCARCSAGFQAQENILVVENKQFHAHCFTCSRCSKSLSSEQYIQDEERHPFCVQCFTELNPRTKVVTPDQLDQQCSICKRTFDGVDAVVSHMDKIYHLDCYVCDVCLGRVEDSVVYPNPNGKCGIVCESCHRKRLAECGKCGGVIDEGEKFVKWNEREFHADCFRCSKCEKTLSSTNFLAVEKTPVCFDCSRAN